VRFCRSYVSYIKEYEFLISETHFSFIGTPSQLGFKPNHRKSLSCSWTSRMYRRNCYRWKLQPNRTKKNNRCYLINVYKIIKRIIHLVRLRGSKILKFKQPQYLYDFILNILDIISIMRSKFRNINWKQWWLML